MSQSEWIKLLSHLVGLPFEWGGRGPVAFDCWGLVAETFRLAGRESPGSWLADDSVAAARIMEEQIASPSWVRVEGTPEPFDVAAMSTHRVIHHVGVVTPFGVLTTTRELGSVHESMARLQQQGYKRMEFYRWAG